MAPALGFEPRTKWLTATYSTAELCRSVNVSNISHDFIIVKQIFEKFSVFFEKLQKSGRNSQFTPQGWFDTAGVREHRRPQVGKHKAIQMSYFAVFCVIFCYFQTVQCEMNQMNTN